MLVTILKYLSQLLILAVGFAALLWERRAAEDDPSKRKPKSILYVAGASILVAFSVFVATDLTDKKENARKAAEQAKVISSLEQVVAGQKDEIELAEHINSAQEGLNEQAKELNAQQTRQLSLSEGLTEDQKEQISISNGLADAQRKQLQLSNNLTAKQKEQIRRLVEMRLDRELIGVEVSFTPSAEHWNRIAHACDKIKPASPGFPYSASTIKAERVGGYWDIDFSEINREAGSILPPPVSTQSPEGKAFEEVINLAMVELMIEWGGSSLEPGEVTMLSARGNYPTSITISKDIIAFTFRPPKIKLNLSEFHNNPFIKLRSQQYPTAIRFRSLDNKVKFDEQVTLSWVKKRGSTHVEKWLPYISEPHRLNIDWSSLLN
jgi:hypothetical protein